MKALRYAIAALGLILFAQAHAYAQSPSIHTALPTPPFLITTATLRTPTAPPPARVFRAPFRRATVNAASCTVAAVTTAIGTAVSGDTVQLPTCDVIWTGSLTVAKNIILQGNGCDLDGSGRSTNCNTRISNGIDDGSPMIAWTCPANSPDNRVTQIEFANDDGPVSALGVINVACNSSGTTRFRADHNIFDALNTHSIRAEDAIGVVDHNWFKMDNGQYTEFAFHRSWLGVGANGDNSWFQATNFGSESFLFLETNLIDYSAGSGGNACIDNHTGFRGVVRYNEFKKCFFSNHGTDSANRDRGTVALEIYGNYGDNGGAPSVQISDIRSGSAMIWGNTKTNVQPGFPATSYVAATLTTDRTIAWFTPFSGADGRIPWDLNNPGNPFNPGADAGCTSTACTASSAGTLTVTVTGANWSTNEWQDNADPYIIRKTSACAARNCAAIIISNTADTITFSNAGGFGLDLTFSGGATFEIVKVSRAFDAPGRRLGALVPNRVACTEITSTGTAATATCAGHGGTTGRYMAVRANAGFYDGTYQITVTDADTFTYTCRSTCGATATGDMDTTLMPTTMNDQVDEPVYEWLNYFTTDGAAFLVHSRAGYPGSIENATYYNYTTGFNGTVGVGSGTRAARPASTTNGVAYWSTDAGGNWNTASGGANDGCLDKVVSGAWVNCFYTPFTYPHPMTGGAAADLMPGNSGALVAVMVKQTSLVITWAEATDGTSAQEDLEYRCFRSATNNIGTVVDAEANGTAINAYTADIASCAVTGLATNTAYWFNVVVRNEAGDKAAYTQRQRSTTRRRLWWLLWPFGE